MVTMTYKDGQTEISVSSETGDGALRTMAAMLKAVKPGVLYVPKEGQPRYVTSDGPINENWAWTPIPENL